MTVLLVRHARAGRRDRWRGDDRQRPLTKRGRVQAEALVGVLARWPDAAVLSSPWVRCIQTLEPLAGLGVSVDEALGEGMGAKAWELLTELLETRTAVLCSHGDVIDNIRSRLAAAGCHLDGPLHAAKGSVWVIESMRVARYVPPPL